MHRRSVASGLAHPLLSDRIEKVSNAASCGRFFFRSEGFADSIDKGIEDAVFVFLPNVGTALLGSRPRVSWRGDRLAIPMAYEWVKRRRSADWQSGSPARVRLSSHAGSAIEQFEALSIGTRAATSALVKSPISFLLLLLHETLLIELLKAHGCNTPARLFFGL
jgi:hypothetical protein